MANQNFAKTAVFHSVGHIVNCFIASGYDEETVICNLDVSDKPGNEVESYINRKFADSPKT